VAEVVVVEAAAAEVAVEADQEEDKKILTSV